MRRIGSRIAPRRHERGADQRHDRIARRRSRIRTSPIARRPRQIGLIIWDGRGQRWNRPLKWPDPRRDTGSVQRQLHARRKLSCKALVDAELEVEGAILMAQHDGGRHQRFAGPQSHDLALAGLGQR